MTKVRKQKSEVKSKIFTAYYILFVIFFLICSCGKKGDPTLKSYEKPHPPSELGAIHRESEIILSWEFPKNKETGIKGFYLLKSTGEDFKKIEFIENSKRSYIDRDIKIGSKYRYKIVSQNLKDVLSVDSNIIDAEIRETPASPQSLSFKIKKDSLVLTWENAGEGVLYNIYKSDKKGIYPLMPLNNEPVKKNTFADDFDINKIVYYTIRGLWGDAIRNEGTPSKELEINPKEFVPSPPQNLQAVPTKENVYLIWKEPPETWISGYRIYRKTDKKEEFILIGETQIPSFLDKDPPSTNRSYRVTSTGPSKESSPTEIKDIIFVPQR
ncbi:MAG: hypothetical protein AB1610_09875 [Nitrospirota bacterium]